MFAYTGGNIRIFSDTAFYSFCIHETDTESWGRLCLHTPRATYTSSVILLFIRFAFTRLIQRVEDGYVCIHRGQHMHLEWYCFLFVLHSRDWYRELRTAMFVYTEGNICILSDTAFYSFCIHETDTESWGRLCLYIPRATYASWVILLFIRFAFTRLIQRVEDGYVCIHRGQHIHLQWYCFLFVLHSRDWYRELRTAMFVYTEGNICILSDTAFYSFCIHETDTESWGRLCLHTPRATYTSSVILLFIRFAFTRLIQRVEDGYVCIHRGQHMHLEWYCFLFVLHSRDWYRELRTAMFAYTEGNIYIFSDTAFYSFCIHETDTESWGRLCLYTPRATYASWVILLFIRFAFTRLIQRVEDGYVCIHRGQHIHLQWYCFLFVLHSRDWYRELRTAMFVYTEGNICIFSDTAFYSFCIHETDTESWGRLCLHTPRATYTSSVILLFIRFAFTRLIQRVEDGYVCIHRGQHMHLEWYCFLFVLHSRDWYRELRTAMFAYTEGNIYIFSDTAFYSFCIHETDTESWGRLCLYTPRATYASWVILLFIRFAFTRLIQRVEDGYVCIHRGQHIHLQWYCFLFVLHSRDWYRELRTAMFVYTEGNICILSDTAFYSFCIHETDTESWGRLCLHTPRATYTSSVILLFIRFAFTRLIQRVEDGYVCIHRGQHMHLEWYCFLFVLHSRDWYRELRTAMFAYTEGNIYIFSDTAFYSFCIHETDTESWGRLCLYTPRATYASWVILLFIRFAFTRLIQRVEDGYVCIHRGQHIHLQWYCFLFVLHSRDWYKELRTAMFVYTEGNICILSDTAFYSFCIHETDTESWGRLCLHTPRATYTSSVILLFIRFAFTRLIQRVEDGYVCIHRGQHMHLEWYCFLFVLHSRDWYRELRTAMFAYTEGNIYIFSDTAFYSFCIHETDTESWGRLCLHTPRATYASWVILLFIRFAFTRLIQRVEDGYVCIHRGQHIHLQWYCFLFVLHSRDWYRELRTAMFAYTEGNIRIFSDTAFYSFCIHETDTESWGRLCLYTPRATYASSVILLFIRFAFTRLIQRVEDGYVCIHRGQHTHLQWYCFFFVLHSRDWYRATSQILIISIFICFLTLGPPQCTFLFRY